MGGLWRKRKKMKKISRIENWKKSRKEQQKMVSFELSGVGAKAVVGQWKLT